MAEHVDIPPIVYLPSRWQRWKMILALLLLFGSGIFVATNYYRYFGKETRQHFSRSEVALRQAIDDDLKFEDQVASLRRSTLDYLKSRGGVWDRQFRKGSDLYVIDLSQWRGRDRELNFLSIFQTLINCTSPPHTSDNFELMLPPTATDHTLLFLKNLISLEKLSLRGSSVSDAGVPHLAGLPRLHSLNLTSTSISDASVEVLASFPILCRLNLTDTAVTPQGVLRLAQLNPAVEVRCFDAIITDGAVHITPHSDLAALGDLCAAGDFSQICLEGCAVPDADLLMLAGQRKLTVVNLSRAQISDAGLHHLGSLPMLEELQLGSTPVTGLGFERAKGWESLRWLDLSDSRVTDVGLSGLSGMNNLQVLDLSRTRITGVGFEALTGLDRLTELRLTGSDFTDASLTFVGRLANLRVLELGGTHITGSGFEGLSTLRHLETLILSNSRITDENLVHLAPLASLTHLDLSSTTVTDKGLEYLSQCHALRRLDLAHTRISTEKAIEWQKHHPEALVIDRDHGFHHPEKKSEQAESPRE